MTATARLQPHYAFELVRSPYLESGWLQHGNYAPLGELTYVPSTLVYGSKQAGGEAQGFVSFVNGLVAGAETLTAPRPSNAIVNRYFPPTLRTRSLNGFESGSPIYAADPGLPGAKKCQATNAPSRYTGLLALFVQAVYGTAPRRYATGENGGLSIDGVGLKFEGTDSHWLCWFPQTEPEGATKILTGATAPSPSDGNNGDHWHDIVSKKWYGPKKAGAWGEGYWLGRKYWLCQLVGDRLTFAQVETIKPQFDPSATGADADKIHATLLAHSKIGKVSKSFQVGKVKGAPLAYGWKANADGSKAQTVCHENLTDRRYARAYEISVSADAQGNPKSASLSTFGEGEWDVRPGRHNLWFPDFTLGKTKALKPVAQFGTPLTFDAPLYVRAHGTTISIQGSSDLYGSFGVDGLSVSPVATHAIPDEDVYTVLYKREYGSQSPNLNDYWVQKTQDPQWYAPAWTAQDFEFPASTSERLSCYALYGYGYARQLDTYRNRTTGTDASVSLMVPLGECEARLSGSKSVTTTFNGSQTVGRQGTTSWVRTTWYWWRREDPEDTYSPQSWHHLGDMWQTDGQSGGEALLGFGQFNDQFLGTTTYNVTTTDTAKAMTFAFRQGDGSLPSPNDNYFNAQIGPSGDPNINPFYVFGSAGGSYSYSGSYGEAGESDWPGGVPVGWA